jgi:hypothetical protein
MPAIREALAASKFVCCVVFLLSLSGAVGLAQTSVDDVHLVPRQLPPPHGGCCCCQPVGGWSLLHVIKSDVKLVPVPVSLSDPMERFVTGLRAENFQLFEGKKSQEIRHFWSEDVPISIGIILDASGSMGGKMNRVKRRTPG